MSVDRQNVLRIVEWRIVETAARLSGVAEDFSSAKRVHRDGAVLVSRRNAGTQDELTGLRRSGDIETRPGYEPGVSGRRPADRKPSMDCQAHNEKAAEMHSQWSLDCR